MFDFLFGKTNPSKSWSPRESEPAQLLLDLDQGSLNNVPLGQAIERLSFLGVDESHFRQKDGILEYPSLGLAVWYGSKDGLIEAYRVVLADPWAPNFQPFHGSVWMRGDSVDLKELSIEKFERMYPQPYWRDRADDETILFYEFEKQLEWLEWQVEFTPDGRFCCLIVTRNPLLANSAQRASYGVTTPWPPRKR